MTVMKNLVVKGAVDIDTSEFKHRYSTIQPRKAFVQVLLRDIIGDFYNAQVDDFINEIRGVDVPERPPKPYVEPTSRPKEATPSPPARPGFNKDGSVKKRRGRPPGSKNRVRDGVNSTLTTRTRVDSLDKIIPAYFGAVTEEPFEFHQKLYPVTQLYVSPKLLRGFLCKEHCGACCGRYSIDFLPHETPPENAVERQVEFNGRSVTVISDMQEDFDSHFCRYVSTETGRCSIHDDHALGCDFELIRVIHKKKLFRYEMSTCLYTRGWNMARPTGGRGNQCEILEPSPEAAQDIKRKMLRLKEWTDHFGLETRLPTIIEWIDYNTSRPEWAQPLIFNVDKEPPWNSHPSSS
jgi:Fe-S-cluster containining protein